MFRKRTEDMTYQELLGVMRTGDVRLGFWRNVKDGLRLFGNLLTFGAMFSGDGTLARDAIVYNGIRVSQAYSQHAARVRAEERTYDEGRLEDLGTRIGRSIAQEMIAEAQRQQQSRPVSG